MKNPCRKFLSFPVKVALRKGEINAKTKKAPFGCLEWICLHKVLKRSKMLPQDIFALEVWPTQLHQAFLQNVKVSASAMAVCLGIGAAFFTGSITPRSSHLFFAFAQFHLSASQKLRPG